MKKPPLPNNEAKRIETLHSLGILDTPQEARFDNITRLAKNFFQVPIAIVSLVDTDRQWSKSCIGLDENQIDRNISFCAHAILDNEALIVNDTLQDERFSDNPLVLDEPKIRFYAGYPIAAPNGSKLGTLCIIDQQPRELNHLDITLLANLAALVEREIAITELALTDELTQISNRRGFITLAQQELSLCKRDKVSASLIFFDLNTFKYINDNYGHAESELALVNFINAIKTVLRESDIIGRIGSNEFALLLRDISEQQIQALLKRCLTLLAETNNNIKKGYKLSFSYGIITIQPDSSTSIEHVLLQADSFMYRNKL